MVPKTGYTDLSGDEHHHGGDGQCYEDIGLSSGGNIQFQNIVCTSENKLIVKFQAFVGEYDIYGIEEQ